MAARPLSPKCFAWALCALLALLLAGCVDDFIYPTRATQTIVIRNDNTVEVAYEGTFNDVYPQFKALIDLLKKQSNKADEAPMPTQVAYDEQLRQKMVTDNDQWGVQITSPGRFALHYRKTWKAQEGSYDLAILPSLQKHVLLLSLPQPVGEGVYMHSVDTDITKLLQEVDAKEAHNSKMPQEKKVAREMRALVQSIVKQIQGDLVLRTDGDMLRHNADKVEKLPGGMRQYTWRVNGKTLHRAQWTLAVGTAEQRNRARLELADRPSDCDAFAKASPFHNACVLKVAAPNTACASLVGDVCKCGPFQLVLPDGQVQANKHYRITHPTGVAEGCSDAQGNVAAIASEVTGVCRLVVIHTEANDPCADGKVPPRFEAGH